VIRIEKTIEVATPAKKAFAQWAQYDSYPLFMENVHEVKETAKNRLHWRAKRHSLEVEWESEITTKVPGRMIAWRDVGETGNNGTVTIHELDANHCRVQLIMHANLNAQPQQAAESEVALIERIEADLARFKALIEHPEARPFDNSDPGETGVEYGQPTKVPTNELLTDTPGSPKVPTPEEMATSPTADGKDNRIDLNQANTANAKKS
jgi:uncharacterized membrane protein